MNKLKIFVTSVICLVLCIFSFGCSGNSMNNNSNPPSINSPNSSNQPSNSVNSSTGNTGSENPETPTIKSDIELVGFVTLVDVGIFGKDFDALSYVNENIDFSNNNLSSYDPFINIITSSSGYQSEDDINLDSSSTILKETTSINSSKFNLLVKSEVFLETKTIYVIAITRKNNEVSLNELGKIDFDDFAENVVVANFEDLYKNSNISEIKFLFSTDISTLTDY